MGRGMDRKAELTAAPEVQTSAQAPVLADTVAFGVDTPALRVPSLRTPGGLRLTTLPQGDIPMAGNMAIAPFPKVPSAPEPSKTAMLLRAAVLAAIAMVATPGKAQNVGGAPRPSPRMTLAPALDAGAAVRRIEVRAQMDAIAPKADYPGWDRAMALRVATTSRVPTIFTPILRRDDGFLHRTSGYVQTDNPDHYIRYAIANGCGDIDDNCILLPERNGTLGIYDGQKDTVLGVFRGAPAAFRDLDQGVTKALAAAVYNRWNGYQTHVATIMGPEFVRATGWDDNQARVFTINLARGMVACPEGQPQGGSQRDRVEGLMGLDPTPETFALVATCAASPDGLERELAKLERNLHGSGYKTAGLVTALATLREQVRSQAALRQADRDRMTSGSVRVMSARTN